MLIIFTGCREQILHDLSEQDANRVITVLHSQAIVGAKELQPDGKWFVSVSSDEAVNALGIISQKRIIKNEARPIKKSSVMSSREAQRFEYERELSQEIEKTLLSIDGVFDARVHLKLTPIDPILGTQREDNTGSASALLVLAKDTILERIDIASLIGGAAGIKSGMVSIVIRETEETLNPIKINRSETSLSHYFKSNIIVTTVLGLTMLGLVFIILKKTKKLLFKGKLSNLSRHFEGAS